MRQMDSRSKTQGKQSQLFYFFLPNLWKATCTLHLQQSQFIPPFQVLNNHMWPGGYCVEKQWSKQTYLHTWVQKSIKEKIGKKKIKDKQQKHIWNKKKTCAGDREQTNRAMYKWWLQSPINFTHTSYRRN